MGRIFVLRQLRYLVTIRQTVAALVVGASLGVGGSAVATDASDAMLALIGGVSADRLDLSLRSRIVDVTMRASPNADAAALGWSGASWRERRYCPADADDEIAALVAACSVVENLDRPAIVLGDNPRTRLQCAADGVCIAVEVTPPPAE